MTCQNFYSINTHIPKRKRATFYKDIRKEWKFLDFLMACLGSVGKKQK